MESVKVYFKENISWENTISLKKDTEKAALLKIAKSRFRYTVWFVFSEKYIMRCTFLCYGTSVHPKSQQGIQKHMYQNFQLFQSSINLMWTSSFYRYEHVYTYRKQEF